MNERVESGTILHGRSLAQDLRRIHAGDSTENDVGGGEDGFDAESYDDDDFEYAGEDYFDDEEFDDFPDEESYGEIIEAETFPEMPEELKRFPEWRDAYEQGVTYHDAIRLAMGPEYATLTDEEADEFLQEAVAEMSPEEAEGFLSSLGSIASKVLPVAGGALGTLIPIPGVGTAIGTALGGLAGKAIGSATRGRPRRRRRSRRRSRPASRGRGATRMRSQLLRLLQNPQLLQTLTGSLLGGRGATRVGDSMQERHLGEFLEALQYFAEEAAAEAHEEQVMQRSSGEASETAGMTDIAARAEQLMDALDDAAAY